MSKDIFSKEISGFFSAQLSEWELAGTNYFQLEKVKTRTLRFDGFEVLVQFNPERLRSTAAKTDSDSLKARPCFLCEANRPVQQRGVSFDDEFTVLVNPFPIFRRHLTIVSSRHTNQVIMNNFDTMLSLAEALPDYVIFYNGPLCGASAPDHLHFQAGNRSFIPLEKDFNSQQFVHPVINGTGFQILNWTGYLRGIITLKGSERKLLESYFNAVFDKLSAIRADKPEPMLNILVYKSDAFWIIHIIPRKKHRPLQFFAAEKERLVLSPASVDLGGIIIAPREEDYNRIKEFDIEDIFRQVCFSEDELYKIILDLK